LDSSYAANDDFKPSDGRLPNSSAKMANTASQKLETPKAKQSHALGSQNGGQRHCAEGTRAQLHATGRLRELPAGT
jgi:hypothetical protein